MYTITDSSVSEGLNTGKMLVGWNVPEQLCMQRFAYKRNSDGDFADCWTKVVLILFLNSTPPMLCSERSITVYIYVMKFISCPDVLGPS